MTKFKFLPILVLLFLCSRVLAQERVNYEAPSLIGHSLRMMKTAGFWISRHPSPDAVIMDLKAIDQFNARLRNDKKLTKDIFMNKTMTDYYDYVRMGMRLPLAGVDTGRVMVDVAVKSPDGSLAVKEAYMNAEDVNGGFLPFTARNIYKQALMMLNQPYGWGDMYGEQDCSRFLQMVFATVGIALPRDSKDQAQVSNSVVDFDEKSDDAAKVAAIARAPAANTLLAMKGHIMLYLGMFNGKPYAIHGTTGYKQTIDQKETTYAINRVIISDLSLGQRSQKGSLLRRLTRTVTIE